jgi:hypothetical protein
MSKDTIEPAAPPKTKLSDSAAEVKRKKENRKNHKAKSSLHNLFIICLYLTLFVDEGDVDAVDKKEKKKKKRKFEADANGEDVAMDVEAQRESHGLK